MHFSEKRKDGENIQIKANRKIKINEFYLLNIRVI